MMGSVDPAARKLRQGPVVVSERNATQRPFHCALIGYALISYALISYAVAASVQRKTHHPVLIHYKSLISYYMRLGSKCDRSMVSSQGPLAPAHGGLPRRQESQRVSKTQCGTKSSKAAWAGVATVSSENVRGLRTYALFLNAAGVRDRGAEAWQIDSSPVCRGKVNCPYEVNGVGLASRQHLAPGLFIFQILKSHVAALRSWTEESPRFSQTSATIYYLWMSRGGAGPVDAYEYEPSPTD
ncbi:hypothetical protein N7510_004354 [Penicillium lagena]|uniref:uncharacterized protein n=1 Tax=Penicillium lagena TaxID=94218 RepID=UPI0025409FC2|nr:uncharacterized protein N7510_004354 [Penicillium lagena]KAJ5620370.1 hypothetical protein N7510_004354 [Penicillium lagena]